MIPFDPADKIQRPKMDRFIATFYDSDEMQKLSDAVEGNNLKIAVLFGAFYGLRNSEIVGLRWDAILTLKLKPSLASTKAPL